MSLTDLKTKYFAPNPVPYDEVTEVRFLIDGSEYFPSVFREMIGTRSGDVIYIVGWFFDPDFGPVMGYRLGDLLVEKAYAGVDVRIILNGAQFYGALGAAWFFARNYVAMSDLQARKLQSGGSPPLLGRILYDWSGADGTGSHHQKAVFITRGLQMTAFVGGLDFNPLHNDAAPHNSVPAPPPPGSTAWNWHDGAIQLVGGAAYGVWENFADRWKEASTLPSIPLMTRRGSALTAEAYGPPATPLPITPQTRSSAANPTPGLSIQVLRSRFRSKLNRLGEGKVPWNPNMEWPVTWDTYGFGPIYEVFKTMKQAISLAEHYIYIEDQFLSDVPPGTVLESIQAFQDAYFWFSDPAEPLTGYSLFPHLQAALSRGVKVICVGSGYADPGDASTGPKNLSLNRQLAALGAVSPANLAVWRIEEETVHMKLVIIDDKFAAIGSANLQSRSMAGVDSELHVGVVDSGVNISRLRARLWAEDLGLDFYALPSQEVFDALIDWTQAIGMWRSNWGPPGMWFATNNPQGFIPAVLVPGIPRTRVVRAYVGPGGTP